jgi:hypothetical protein
MCDRLANRAPQPAACFPLKQTARQRPEMGYCPRIREDDPMKSPNQILAEKLANRELEIANLTAVKERLELRLKEVSDEVASLRQCPARPVAMRRIHDEGDEANGAALWH